jgi:hypothetical protein
MMEGVVEINKAVIGLAKTMIDHCPCRKFQSTYETRFNGYVVNVDN